MILFEANENTDIHLLLARWASSRLEGKSNRAGVKGRATLIWYDFLVALFFAAFFVAIFGVAFRRQRRGAELGVFFILLLLIIWAGGIWLKPFGPPVGSTYWIGFFVVGFIFALLITALLAAGRRGRNHEAGRRQEESQLRRAVYMADVFLWVLIVSLIMAILIYYIR